jgi:hypothetical protein
MGRINQDIVEYSFSTKSTLSYELSLLVGPDSVYYMVNDAQLNVLALKSFHNDLKKERTQLSTFKDAFFEDYLLKEPYRVSKIVFTTPHFTFVPNKFYNEKEHSTYFQNLTDFTYNTVFEADSLKSLDFTNVYAVEKSLHNFTQSTFPMAKRFHIFSALIQGCQKIAESRNGHQIFANIRDGFVQILFFDGKELIFANAYPFQTPQDLIYYIMMVYEQFKLNPESIPLSISGNMTEDSDIFKYIYRYVRVVNFIKAPTYFRLGQEFTGIPQHFYFDLFSIKLCE